MVRLLAVQLRHHRAFYLMTFTTRHVTRTAVTTQTSTTMFLKVGRCASVDGIRDSVAAAVEELIVLDWSSSVADAVALKCVAAGESSVCVRGSPATRHTAAHMKVNTRLCVVVMTEETIKKTKKTTAVRQTAMPFKRVVSLA